MSLETSQVLYGKEGLTVKLITKDNLGHVYLRESWRSTVCSLFSDDLQNIFWDCFDSKNLNMRGKERKVTVQKERSFS